MNLNNYRHFKRRLIKLFDESPISTDKIYLPDQVTFNNETVITILLLYSIIQWFLL
jgi:hypothetical protein